MLILYNHFSRRTWFAQVTAENIRELWKLEDAPKGTLAATVGAKGGVLWEWSISVDNISSDARLGGNRTRREQGALAQHLCVLI
jgi:hypothetical protein